MKARELSIYGAWEFLPEHFPDNRGTFFVWFDSDVFRETVGYELTVGQTNHSTNHRGTIRGVHWASTPPGQAKYVYCPKGAVLDVVVDLRVGSPTFGQHEAVLLEPSRYNALFLAAGIGHSFISLEPDSVLTYLCSERYRPSHEHVVSALDPDLALPWPAGIEPILSERDIHAQSLRDAEAAGILPQWEECQAFYQELSASTR